MAYEVCGKSLWKYCQENGLRYFSVINRMNDKCETAEQAVKNICPIILYDGKSRAQICKEHDIPHSSCCRLMKNKGFTLEQAINHLLELKRKRSQCGNS